ncbi:MAG: LptF/LptG family permease [Puniceicoccales bacterium]|jgi:lipopolysaccharide export system permease protein|nr:LptF/LptG family permease [Puniceicoccales bacterium]
MIYRRYIFFQTFFACCATTLLFVVALLLGNLLKDILQLIVSGSITVGFFFKALAMLIPTVVTYALPLGVVTGVLIAMGKMVASNEIFILQVSGVSLWRIAVPVLAFAALSSFASLCINFFYAPHVLYNYRQMLKNLICRAPLNFIIPNHFVHDFAGYVIFSEDRDGDCLKGLSIWELDSAGKLEGFLHAKIGELSYDEERGLRLTLSNGSMERYCESDRGPSPTVHFREFSLQLPTGLSANAAVISKRLKHRNLFELIDALDHWSSTDVAPELRSEEQRRRDRIAVNHSIQQHIAMGTSIFILAFLSIPLAMEMRRGETAINGVIAILLALSYYFAMAISHWMLEVPNLRADLLVWVPNGVLFSVAILLWTTMDRCHK